jgi:hypothetical protein
MYTPLEQRILSVPVPGLNLPALIEPTESDLMQREAELGWNRADGVGELLFTLRINGVAVVFVNEIFEVIGGRNVRN